MLSRKAVRRVWHPEGLAQSQLRQINHNLNSTELQILTDTRSVESFKKIFTVSHMHNNENVCCCFFEINVMKLNDSSKFCVETHDLKFQPEKNINYLVD